MTDSAAHISAPIRKPTAARRALRHRLVIPSLIVLVFVSVMAGGMIGPAPLATADFFGIILNKVGITVPWAYESGQSMLLLQIRLPRVVLGALIGAALAICGAALQGLFRNPLADPGLIGVSSGAAVGAVAAIVLGSYVISSGNDWMRPWLTSGLAFVGGMVVIALVYNISSVAGRVIIATMLLTGIALNSLVGAFIGMLTYLANDAQLRDITFWTLGSLNAASWTIVGIVAPPVLIALLLLPRLGRPLNALLLGEAEAGHLGFDVRSVKRQIIVITALAVAGSVAFTGLIGFIGLVVPHLVRMWAGPDHRTLLPASALLGAALLVLADVGARTFFAPAEVPIGILTALIGAPFFLLMILRQRSRLSL